MNTLARIDQDWLLAAEIHKLEARIWRRVKRDNIKVILLTSAVRGEGKTTTAAYLSTALALHPDRKIAVIDFDFREPKLNRHFEFAGPLKLGAALRGEVPITEVLVKTDLPNLDLVLPLPEGEDPGLLRQNRVVTEIVDYFRKNYDLTILDVPSLIPVADASGLLPYADGVILVAMAGKTTKLLLNRAREICLGMDANIMGMVVGNLKVAAPEYVDSGYQYGYR